MKRNFLPVVGALFICAILLTVALFGYIEQRPSVPCVTHLRALYDFRQREIRLVTRGQIVFDAVFFRL